MNSNIMMKKTLISFIVLALFTVNTNAEGKKSPGKPINLTNAVFLSKIFNYEKNPTTWIYLNEKPSIIDFYASWCGPCKTLSPILAELASEYADEIYVYKVNVDKEKDLAAAFGINSIPIILFCPMDESPQMIQGAYPKEYLKKIIDEFLLKKKEKN